MDKAFINILLDCKSKESHKFASSFSCLKVITKQPVEYRGLAGEIGEDLFLCTSVPSPQRMRRTWMMKTRIYFSFSLQGAPLLSWWENKLYKTLKFITVKDIHTFICEFSVKNETLCFGDLRIFFTNYIFLTFF